MRILCDTKVNCRIIAFTALCCIGSAIERERTCWVCSSRWRFWPPQLTQYSVGCGEICQQGKLYLATCFLLYNSILTWPLRISYLFSWLFTFWTLRFFKIGPKSVLKWKEYSTVNKKSPYWVVKKWHFIFTLTFSPHQARVLSLYSISKRKHGHRLGCQVFATYLFSK